MTKTCSAVLLVVASLALTGCSLLDRALQHGQDLLETRSDKKQAGWKWEGFLTCSKPTLHIEANGERWCSLQLAPTMADCTPAPPGATGEAEGRSLAFWFGDELSGMSRRVLYELCRTSEFGERWPHLDGIFQEGRLVVLDANNGSKPL